MKRRVIRSIIARCVSLHVSEIYADFVAAKFIKKYITYIWWIQRSIFKRKLKSIISIYSSIAKLNMPHILRKKKWYLLRKNTTMAQLTNIVNNFNFRVFFFLAHLWYLDVHISIAHYPQASISVQKSLKTQLFSIQLSNSA